jgi:protein phosphatase
LFFRRKKDRPASITFGQRSDIGRLRTENQDCCGKFPAASLNLSEPQGLLFIVADGMGGHAAGREASAMAVETVQQVYFSNPSQSLTERLQRALQIANEKIYNYARRFAGDQLMGTTCTALVMKEASGCIAHVGDSRIYRITRESIKQLTHDHTEVAAMLRDGLLTEQEALQHPERSRLNRALGINADLEVDLIENIPLQANEHFLLCTDGLVKVDPAEIKKIVLAHEPQQACDQLIQLALKRGGHDNVTAQVIRVNHPAP